MTTRRQDGDGRKTLVVFTQVFVPDPASVGQHMADVTFEMARRGHRVVVFTSARGYDDPSVEYTAREVMDGVEVHRLPLTSFGKQAISLRVLATASFMAQCALLGIVEPGISGIFFSTSPPLVGVVAAIAGAVRSVPIAHWAMDLNPDQLIALGKLSASSPTARILTAANRFLLERSSLVVALDRFMADRLSERARLGGKLCVMPPWPHDEHLEATDAEIAGFRAEHGLTGKFVVMYSGNHSPSNPLRTLLEAALRLREEDAFRFVFVGGGLGKAEVEIFARNHALPNVLSLPYQPLGRLGRSLSSADVHVVSLGDSMVGIIHPCKVYAAMAIGRPILYFGPENSHVADILDEASGGWKVAHGDVDAAIRALHEMRSTPASLRDAMGRRSHALLAKTLGQAMLTKRFCDQLETSLGFRSIAATEARG